MPSHTLQSTRVAERLPLEVSAAGDSRPSLIAFDLGGGGIARMAQGTGLAWLGGDFEREYWQVSRLNHHDIDGGWRACSDSLMSLSLSRPVTGGTDFEAMTADLYRALLEQVREAGFPELLRIWNYLPGINQGEGDRERYRRFCVGRGTALTEAGLDDAGMPAATAIGTQDRHFRLIALAGRRPGRSFENPRQVSAWQYPSRYGPRSPAFARATAIKLEGAQAGLLISGTASVVGHATTHPGDVLAQTDEAAANVDTLLESAAERMGQPGLARFGAKSLVRIYVRHAGDWPAVAERLRDRWPEAALAGLCGDICRRDLLVEIEAWHCADAASDGLPASGTNEGGS